MKRLIFGLVVCALMSTPALAVPTIEFSPQSGNIGWYYSGTSDGTNVSGALSFNDNMYIDAALGGTSDPIIGAYIDLSGLTVTGTTGSSTYTLGTGNFTISSASGGAGTVYLNGTIETGILAIIPMVPDSAATLSAVTTLTLVNQTSPVSTALTQLDAWDGHMVLSLQGGSNWQTLLDTVGNNRGQDGMSGQITVPAPGAILLGSMGVGLVGWLRRRRSL